jgi:hypothetical protein
MSVMNMDNIPDYDEHSSDEDQKLPQNKSGKG